MTTLARRVRATPSRSEIETWDAIRALLTLRTENPGAVQELERASGVLASIIGSEVLGEEPLVLLGAGPRVKVYCLYGEDAMDRESAHEEHIPHDLFAKERMLSIPCLDEDYGWVENAIKLHRHLRLRHVGEETQPRSEITQRNIEIDEEAFRRP